MLRGFFKVYRKIENWAWWHDPITLAVWIHILHRARYGNIPKNYKGDVIYRGELVLGLKEFSKECGISVQNLRTALNHLEKTKELTRKLTTNPTSNLTTKYHHYIVENYAFYQDYILEGNNETNKEVTRHQQQKNKENKEIKNVCMCTDEGKGDDKESSCAASRTNTYAYGKFNNVFLTPEEFQELKDTYEDSRRLINKVSIWLTEHDRKNHFAVCLKFADADDWCKKPHAIRRSSEGKEFEALTMAEIDALEERQRNEKSN